LHSQAKRNSCPRTHVRRLSALPFFAIWAMSLASPAHASIASMTSGAPSYSLFGAFFPAWMVCALIGIAGAIGTRVVMVASGLAKVLPLQLYVCASVGLTIALFAWLTWFGR